MKIFTFLLLSLFPLIVFAKTYPIIEQDMTEAAKSYAETEEFKHKFEEWGSKKQDQILNYSGVSLPKAPDNSSYEVSYSYTLPRDIPRVDMAGNITGVLYPKGYTFNPLLYLVQPPPPMIIFNPCDNSEKTFVDTYLKNENMYNKMLISTGCALKDIKGYGEFVYPLAQKIVDKFKLRSTVSIVSVDIVKGVFYVQVFKTEAIE